MTRAAGPRRDGLSPAGCSHACLKFNVWFNMYAEKWAIKGDWPVIRDRILQGEGKGVSWRRILLDRVYFA